MKPRISNPFRSLASTITATLALGCFGAPSAFAAIATWTGAGTTGQWNINSWANFGGTQATGGNDVVFVNPDPASWTLTSLGGDRNIKSLTFQAGSPAFDIRLTGGTTATNVYNLTFDSGNTGITVASGDLSSHTIGQASVGGSVVLAGSLTVTHNGSGTLSFDRPITGAGFGLTKEGTGTMRLAGSNTYDGATQVNGGILVFATTAAKASGTVTAGASGIIGLGVGSTGYYTYADVLSLFNDNTLTGFNLDTASGVAIDTTAGNIASQSAALTGNRSLTKLGTGLIQLNVTNTYTGPTIIKQGSLNLGAGLGGGKLNTSSAITIESGADFGIFQNDTVVQGTDFSGAPITGAGGFYIVGSPTVTLNAANNYTGTTSIFGGMLKHEGSATLTSGNLTFEGSTTIASPYNVYNGVLALTDNFTRALGTGDNEVQWTKSGGFAAFGADRTVSLNGGGNVQWGAGSFLPSSRGLILGHTAATHTVTFANNINFATGGTRTIQVDDGAAAVDAVISGTLGISGGENGGFAKTGTGTLQLTNANLYTGATIVSDGTLMISNLAALDSTSGITLEGGTILAPTLDGITLSAPVTLGTTSTTSTIYAPTSGAGTLTLSGAIGGDGNLELYQSTGGNASGTIILGAQSNYLGTTELHTAGAGDSGSRLYVELGIANALPTTTVLNLNGGPGTGTGRELKLDLKGYDQTLAGLNNTTGLTKRKQWITSATPATLTVNNSIACSFGRSVATTTSEQYTRIQDAISLVKSGVGTFTLVGEHTYTGDTTVSEGILSLAEINPSNESSTVTIAASGATLDLTFTGTDTVDKLFIGTTQMAAGVYGPTATSIPQIINSTGTGTLTVTSGPAGGYSSWASTNGAGANLNDDHDGDGVFNGVEYFIGGPNGNTTGFTALPGVTNTAGTLSVTWTKAGDYTGVYATDFVVETSDTLAGWVPAVEGVNPDQVVVSGNNVTYTFPAGTKNFARLKVTGP